MTDTGANKTDRKSLKGPSESLGAWEPRTMDVRRSVEKYSRFVSAMKIALPTIAGLLLAVVIILPQLRGEPEQMSAEIRITN